MNFNDRQRSRESTALNDINRVESPRAIGIERWTPAATTLSSASRFLVLHDRAYAIGYGSRAVRATNKRRRAVKPLAAFLVLPAKKGKSK